MPGWFRGADCTEQINPAEILIKSVHVNGIPALNGLGVDWDWNDPSDGAAPDVYIVINRNGVEVFNSKSKTIAEASGNVTITVNKSITDVNSNYQILCYDADSGGPVDYIDSAEGLLYSRSNGFPGSVQIGCSSCAGRVYFTVDLGYTH